MSCFAYSRSGASVREPSTEEMAALLESLRRPDNEHADVSLTHESGWCMSAFGSGLVCLENVETGDGPWHMRGLSFERILDLWEKLAGGTLRAFKTKGP
jgi:hypothetical protein